MVPYFAVANQQSANQAYSSKATKKTKRLIDVDHVLPKVVFHVSTIFFLRYCKKSILDGNNKKKNIHTKHKKKLQSRSNTILLNKNISTKNTKMKLMSSKPLVVGGEFLDIKNTSHFVVLDAWKGFFKKYDFFFKNSSV